MKQGRPSRANMPANHVVALRLTTAEIEAIKALAGYEPVSSWMRRVVLHEIGGTSEDADGVRAGRSSQDRPVKRVSPGEAASTRRNRRPSARPGARGGSLRRSKPQGA